MLVKGVATHNNVWSSGSESSIQTCVHIASKDYGNNSKLTRH